MNYLKTLLSLLFTSSLMACGGGSSPNPGAEQTSQLITEGINGKSIAVDAMELLGVMLNYEGYLEASPKVPASGPCGNSGDNNDGEKTVDDNGDTVILSYTKCKGSVGNLRFTIDGQYTVNNEHDKIAISSDLLTINNNRQGNWKIESLTLNIDLTANPRTLTANMTMDSSQFGIKVKAVSDQPFAGDDLLCPDSGILTLTAADNSFVTVNGAPGPNLLFNINGENQTVACSEIAINEAPPSDENELTPPGAP